QLMFGRTVYWQATKTEALNYFAYLLLFLAGSYIFRSRRNLRLVATTLVVFGFCYAAFAIAQSLTGTTRLYWWRAPSDLGWMYGGYVDHDHYAGLMEMLAPIAIGMAALAPLSHWKRRWFAIAAVT